MTDRIVAAIEHPLDAIGHPTGARIDGRAPIGVDVDRIVERLTRDRDDDRDQLGADRRDLNDVNARARRGPGCGSSSTPTRTARTRCRTRDGASRPRVAHGLTRRTWPTRCRGGGRPLASAGGNAGGEPA